jgi:hypothetical protein
MTQYIVMSVIYAVSQISHYAECLYAECRGAATITRPSFQINKTRHVTHDLVFVKKYCKTYVAQFTFPDVDQVELYTY